MSDMKLVVGRGGKQVMVRLPEALKAALEDKAGRDGRSMNTEIVLAIAASVGLELEGDVEKLSGARGRRFSEAYPLRMPEGMREALHEDADRNDRSLNSEIIARLSETSPNAKLERVALSVRPFTINGPLTPDNAAEATRSAYEVAKEIVMAQQGIVS